MNLLGDDVERVAQVANAILRDKNLGDWAAESKRLGEFERCQITHRDPETVPTSAGRAPAGQSSKFPGTI